MNKFEVVNRILANWDPIGVGENIAVDEYKGYVPQVLKHLDNELSLNACLESFLISLQVGYDPDNKKHLEDLSSVCENLRNSVRNNKSRGVDSDGSPRNRQ